MVDPKDLRGALADADRRLTAVLEDAVDTFLSASDMHALISEEMRQVMAPDRPMEKALGLIREIRAVQEAVTYAIGELPAEVSDAAE